MAHPGNLKFPILILKNTIKGGIQWLTDVDHSKNVEHLSAEKQNASALIVLRVEESGFKMVCTSPFKVRDPASGYPLDVPCGSCMSCRIERSKEWATRIIHEMEFYNNSSFVTLTYSDEFLPPNASLVKRDVQLFMKRLRRDLGKRKIKYYACGEYGDLYLRPHYHIIILGLHPKQDSDLVKENWTYGRTHLGTVTYQSARYVTSYVQKKLTGKLAESEYSATNRIPPFSLLSKSIGKKFVLENAEELTENLGFTVNGKPCGLPRYYRNILKIDKTDLAERSVDRRKEIIEHYNKKGLNQLHEVSEAIRHAKVQADLNVNARLNLYPKNKC